MQFAECSLHSPCMNAPTPTRVWLNGRLVPSNEATISVFDRGFLFGDGVYEVVRFFDGVAVGMDLHTARLGRSLELTRISGFDLSSFQHICDELLRANSLSNAAVYLQISRGASATRVHMPTPGMAPTVFACASATGALEELERPTLVRCAVMPDRRWHHCEIKSTALLGNLLPMLECADHGAEEAILIRDGLVSEGTSTNVFAVVRGQLVTPPVATTPPILNGVMRVRLLEACAQSGISCAVRPISEAELRTASEIILTASRRMFSSVIELDRAVVGLGTVGPVAARANAALVNRLRAECSPAHHGAPSATPILAS